MSGGVAGARAGTISLMFGGPAEVLEAHRSILDAFAGNVFHVGERAGQGQAMKLLNNFLSATALAATSEALAFGEANGLTLPVMLDVLNVSTGRNSATVDKFPNRVLTGTYDAGFHTALMAKDLRLYVEMVARSDTAMEVGSAVSTVWQAADASMPGQRLHRDLEAHLHPQLIGLTRRNMHFITHCLDKPGALDTRLAHYDEHRAYLANPSVHLVVSGPLLADDGETMIGSCFLTEADSRADVEAFNRGDPFYEHGVWDRDTIRIHAFLKRIDDRA